MILLILLISYSIAVGNKKYEQIERMNNDMQQKWSLCLDNYVGALCRVNGKKYEGIGEEEKCTESLQCIKMGSSLSIVEVIVYTTKETLEEVSKVGIPILLVLILVKQLR